MYVDNLARDGLVVTSCPPALRTCVENAMRMWQRFCTELDFAEKRKLSGGDRRHDYGYMSRTGGGTEDHKELFHLLGKTISSLRMKALGVEGTLASDFLNTLEALQEACAPLVMDFALAVEERYGVHGLSCDVADTKQEWVFRFLHYRGGTATLAHPHIDRGGFTLHLAESRQGAQYLDLNKRWQSLVVDGGRTAIFPSLGLQYCSEGTLKALCHQVQGDVERYAAVAFIDFMKVFAYNQDNGRLQDFEPGFNYDMPFGEFQKLFVTT